MSKMLRKFTLQTMLYWDLSGADKRMNAWLNIGLNLIQTYEASTGDLAGLTDVLHDYVCINKPRSVSSWRKN